MDCGGVRRSLARSRRLVGDQLNSHTTQTGSPVLEGVLRAGDSRRTRCPVAGREPTVLPAGSYQRHWSIPLAGLLDVLLGERRLLLASHLRGVRGRRSGPRGFPTAPWPCLVGQFLLDGDVLASWSNASSRGGQPGKQDLDVTGPACWGGAAPVFAAFTGSRRMRWGRWSDNSGVRSSDDECGREHSSRVTNLPLHPGQGWHWPMARAPQETTTRRSTAEIVDWLPW